MPRCWREWVLQQTAKATKGTKGISTFGIYYLVCLYVCTCVCAKLQNFYCYNCVEMIALHSEGAHYSGNAAPAQITKQQQGLYNG